jgi:hypothetical protein
MGEGNQARHETPIDFKQIEKAIDDKPNGVLWLREDCDRKKGDFSFKIATRSSASLPGL